jgi:hypothetical protein
VAGDAFALVLDEADQLVGLVPALGRGQDDQSGDTELGERGHSRVVEG